MVLTIVTNKIITEKGRPAKEARCIKDWDQHKKDIYKRHFNLLLFTVYINLCKTFMIK